jgi:hypothetical protein
MLRSVRYGKSLTMNVYRSSSPVLARGREREDRPVMKEGDVRIDDCGGIIAGKIKNRGWVDGRIDGFGGGDWNAGVAWSLSIPEINIGARGGSQGKQPVIFNPS